EEIRKADLKMDEENELTEERLQISNFEKIYKALGDAYRSLSADGQGVYAASGIQCKCQMRR
ncbi:hypothetical protein ACUOCP_54765, partial [Escherichia sp. R-CC3]